MKKNIDFTGVNMGLIAFVVIVLAFVAVYLQMLLWNGALSNGLSIVEQINYWQMWGINLIVYFFSLFRYAKVN